MSRLNLLACCGFSPLATLAKCCPSISTAAAFLLVQNSLDTIDFSCNEIARLENFPVMKRLGSLLLGNNQVSRISSSLQAALPSLHTVVLTNNRIASFAEVDALASVPSLRRLSLLGNPVARRPHYRSYLVFRLPHVVELDFEKVRKRERIAAVKWAASAAGRAFLRELDALRSAAHPEITSLPSLLGTQPVGGSATSSGAAAAAGAGAGAGSSAAAAGGAGSGGGGAAAVGSGGFTAEEKVAIAAVLQAASTGEEVAAIEKALRAGKLPAAAAALLEAGAGAGARAASEAARAVAAAAPVPLGLAHESER